MKTVTIPTSKEIAEYRRANDERFELIKELRAEERVDFIHGLLIESAAIAEWELELKRKEFEEKYPSLNYEEMRQYFIV
jgi:hypothetical protein